MKLTFWDAVNPFAAVLLLLFCICLKRAIKKHKNDSEKK